MQQAEYMSALFCEEEEERRVRRVEGLILSFLYYFCFRIRVIQIKRDSVAARNISNFGLYKFCHFYENCEFSARVFNFFFILKKIIWPI